MKVRTFSLFLTLALMFVLISIPAQAQGNSGGAGNGLAAQVAALQSAVTTLQSQVTTLQSQVSTLQGQTTTLQSDDAATQANVSSLDTSVGTLQTDVDKLNGHLTASDLAGTYSLYGFQTELTPIRPVSVGAYVYVGTATVSSDGTGSLNAPQTGDYLVFGQPYLSSADSSDGGRKRSTGLTTMAR